MALNIKLTSCILCLFPTLCNLKVQFSGRVLVPDGVLETPNVWCQLWIPCLGDSGWDSTRLLFHYLYTSSGGLQIVYSHRKHTTGIRTVAHHRMKVAWKPLWVLCVCCRLSHLLIWNKTNKHFHPSLKFEGLSKRFDTSAVWQTRNRSFSRKNNQLSTLNSKGIHQVSVRIIVPFLRLNRI